MVSTRVEEHLRSRSRLLNTIHVTWCLLLQRQGQQGRRTCASSPERGDNGFHTGVGTRGCGGGEAHNAAVGPPVVETAAVHNLGCVHVPQARVPVVDHAAYEHNAGLRFFAVDSRRVLHPAPSVRGTLGQHISTRGFGTICKKGTVSQLQCVLTAPRAHTNAAAAARRGHVPVACTAGGWQEPEGRAVLAAPRSLARAAPCPPRSDQPHK